MPEIDLGDAALTRISSLTLGAGRTAEALRRASKRAERAQAKIQQGRLQAQATQNELESQLDKIVANAHAGLASILALSQLPQIQELARIRAEIQKATPLYIASQEETETDIAVSVIKSGVSLSIRGVRVSDVQSAGHDHFPHMTPCYIKRQFSTLEGTEDEKPARLWLLNLFHADLQREWGDWEFYDEHLFDDNQRPRVSSSLLQHYAWANARDAVLGKWKNEDVGPNHVLFNFLENCATSDALEWYLERSLVRLR